MKAILCEKYGPPEVLQLKEVEKPSPKENEVLVQVHAASANPLDWHFMRGSPFLLRLSSGLRKPKEPTMGVDVAGRVDAVGKNVTRFQPGADVFGFSAGSFAEYAVAREDRLALKPANLSFEAAAAVPIAALTALQSLRDKRQIQPGKKVLINGAAGGVGSFAVQIAKSFGAEVTAVCSTRNQEMVRSIGAAHLIDYTREDFIKNGQRYDLILDAASHHSVSDYKGALNPAGICVVVGGSSMAHMLRVIIAGSWASKIGKKKIGSMMAKPNTNDLVALKVLLESGKVVPVIDRRYTLSQAPEAIRYLEAGHAQGKVIITLQSDSRN
jgi:NADPH:quinone reductase-like Zn-dependent oxidoreductase